MQINYKIRFNLLYDSNSSLIMKYVSKSWTSSIIRLKEHVERNTRGQVYPPAQYVLPGQPTNRRRCHIGVTITNVLERWLQHSAYSLCNETNTQIYNVCRRYTSLYIRYLSLSHSLSLLSLSIFLSPCRFSFSYIILSAAS